MTLRIQYFNFLTRVGFPAIASSIALAFLPISSPLFLSSTSWAQTSTAVKVSPQNQQQKVADIQKHIDAWMNSHSPKEISAIQKYLTDPNKEVRGAAADALGGIGKDAQAAVSDLMKVLREDQAQDVRRSAVMAIRAIDPKPVVKELIQVLKDDKVDSDVRWLSALALGRIKAEEAIPTLKDALKNPNIKVRIGASEALSMYPLTHYTDHQDKQFASYLLNALQDPVWEVRSNAAKALGNMPNRASSAVPQLIEAYKDSNQRLRFNVVFALGEIGKYINGKDLFPDSKLTHDNQKMEYELVPTLIKALKDEELQVCEEAANGLKDIGDRLREQADTNQLSSSSLDRGIKKLDESLKILENSNRKSSVKDQITDLKLSLDALKQKQKIYQLIKSLNNPLLWGIGIYLVALLGMFWLRPLWLMKIDNVLKPISFKVPGIDIEISLKFLLLFLENHPRVLDAWVAAHIQSFREEFQANETVSQRNVHIPIPVVQNGKTLPKLTNKDLRSSFKKRRGCILIWGEGGAGKTNLACQIAKWAMSDNEAERLCKHQMLPVLIEDELIFEEGNKLPFISAIRGHLEDLTKESDPISAELLEQLLRKQRVLVIVDHFSEMSEATRKAIRPESPDFRVNALIVTSRLEERLGGVNKTTLKPLRIEGNRLSSFMEAFLTQKGKRELFTDIEFFDACSRLSQMVGRRNVTALLAELYAKQMIAAKVEEMREVSLQMPDNIPDLMLSYLNELNSRETGDNKLSDRTVQEDSKTITWECLKRTFRPASAKRNLVIDILDKDNAEVRLKYLEQQLRLIQTVNPAQDQIRFTLDPLAEYLAALYLIDFYGPDSQWWENFFITADTMPGAPESIQGFLLALRDCCLVKGKEANVPNFVAEELGKRIQESDKPASLSPVLVPG